MNAGEKRYTDSWPKFVSWTVARALLRSAAAGSGLCGSALPACEAMHAVDEGFPPLIWWRTGAPEQEPRSAEAFANPALRTRGAPATAPVQRETPVVGRRQLAGRVFPGPSPSVGGRSGREAGRWLRPRNSAMTSAPRRTVTS